MRKEMMVPRHIIELVVCNEHRITMPLDVQIRVSGCPNSAMRINKAVKAGKEANEGSVG